MTPATSRAIVRWIHLLVSVPVLGYIYSPFEEIPKYAAPTRYVFAPLIILTGLWMWKGHLVRKMFSKAPPVDQGRA